MIVYATVSGKLEVAAYKIWLWLAPSIPFRKRLETGDLTSGAVDLTTATVMRLGSCSSIPKAPSLDSWLCCEPGLAFVC
jgi:hypothetical protein